MHIFLSLLPDQTIDETFHIMIAQGIEPVPFVPYVEPSVTTLPIPRPLRRVGDVKDKCVTRVKSVYDKRIVLDGSEIWSVGTALTSTYAFFFGVDDIAYNDVGSSYLPNVTNIGATDSEGIRGDSHAKAINIRIAKNKLDAGTVDAFKTYLSATPLTVYYQSTAYDGTNGLDVCLMKYQTGFVELDGTEASHIFEGIFSLDYSAAWPTPANRVNGVCSHYPYRTYVKGKIGLTDNGKAVAYNPNGDYTGDEGGLANWKAYLAAQKAAGTPVQVAYQLAAPEVYATDPVDFDNAAGPLTVLTGGELEAAFKSADKVVESRIDFVEDTLNEQGQAIAEKAPISHSSDKSTYGLGSGSQFGHVKLSDATASGSNAGQGIAATPSAVNQVNARVSTVDGIARAAMPKSGGTFTGNVLASSANEAGAFLRNISVQNSASQLQYTNFIIMVRK